MRKSIGARLWLAAGGWAACGGAPTTMSGSFPLAWVPPPSRPVPGMPGTGGVGSSVGGKLVGWGAGGALVASGAAGVGGTTPCVGVGTGGLVGWTSVVGVGTFGSFVTVSIGA